MRDAFSGGRALPIVTRKFSVAGPGRAPSPRVAWQSPTWSKPSLTCVGKGRIAPGTNKFTPMSEGGPLCFTLFLSSGRQTKKATRGPRRPRMASMPLLSICHSGLHRITNVESYHSGVIGCVRLFRYAHVSISSDCVLTSPDLSMRCRHLFYARSSTKDAQCLSMEQRDKPAFLQCDNFLDRAIASCDKAVHPEADRP